LTRRRMACFSRKNLQLLINAHRPSGFSLYSVVL
jgi:hypothetical protein